MEIHEIKQQLSIQKVLQHYGLEPNKQDMLCCPFHEDKEPSLKVYPQTNTFNCFGCSANGDVIEFIQLKEKVRKHDAILKAQSLVTPNYQPEPLTKPITMTNHDEKINLLTRLFNYFRGAVNNSRPGKSYIAKRGLELYLEIGYNSAQFHHGQRRDEQLINECVKYGILTPTQSRTKAGNTTGYYVFGKNCIVFPLKDKLNQVTGLYFRSILDNTEHKHYYLKDREGLYPNYPKAETTRLILTEAIIDAATLLQLPFITENYEILSCYGTNGFIEEHKQAIQKLKGLQEITIFFDGDKTGMEAARKIAKEIKKLNENLNVSIVNTPVNEDINSLFLSHEPEIFTHLLETATPFILNEKPLIETEEVQTGHALSQKATKLITDNPEQLIYETTELKITIWGGIEKENLSRLKVSMHIKSKTNKYKSFRDDVNLYSHQGTQKLIQNISETLELSTATIIRAITELTEGLEAYRLYERTAMIKALQPKGYEMTGQEKDQALELLQKPGLGKRTLELIRQSGLVGEQKNGLLLFFLYLSRLTEEPLHAIIFGKSGSGYVKQMIM